MAARVPGLSQELGAAQGDAVGGDVVVRFELWLPQRVPRFGKPAVW